MKESEKLKRILNWWEEEGKEDFNACLDETTKSIKEAIKSLKMFRTVLNKKGNSCNSFIQSLNELDGHIQNLEVFVVGNGIDDTLKTFKETIREDIKYLRKDFKEYAIDKKEE